MMGFSIGQLALKFMQSWAALLNPTLVGGSGFSTAPLWFGGVVGLVVVAFVIDWRRNHRDRARLLLFAGIWVTLTFAPFGFVPAVPSTGRYYYVSMLGIALMAVLVVCVFSHERWQPRLLVVLAAAGSWHFLPELWQDLAIYRASGEEVAAIGAGVAELESGASDEPVFLGDWPMFARNAEQVPVVPMFMYGLRDLANPPFAQRPVNLYPLPPIARQIPAAMELSEWAGQAYAWNHEALRCEPAMRDKTQMQLPQLDAVEILAPGEDGVLHRADPLLRFRVPECQSVRVVILAPANPLVRVLPGCEEPNEMSFEVDLKFVEFNDRFYPGKNYYFWVEARQRGRTVIACNAMRELVFADRSD